MLPRLRSLFVLILAGVVLVAGIPEAEAVERRAVRGRKALRIRSCASCNPGVPVEVPRLLGTYDVEISGMEGTFVGEIHEAPQGLRLFVGLTVLSYVDLGVTRTSGSEIELDGIAILGGDFLVRWEGSAQVAKTAKGTAIGGMLRDQIGGEREIVLTRPTAGVPRRLGGRYELTLCNGFCPGGIVYGTTVFDLDVTSSGRGVLRAETLSSPDGDPIGRFARVDCRVSPAGVIDCRGAYEPESASPGPGSQRLHFLGRIHAEGESEGAYLLGRIAPPLIQAESGGWIAVPAQSPARTRPDR